MKKVRIAFVYDAIYPFVKGGAERRFYEMGTRMAALGYDVHWYGMKFWTGPSVREHDGITLHGICKARPLYTTSGRRSITQAIVFGFSCFKLIFAKFDVIDCCGFPYFSLFPAKLAAVLHRRPLYATWHEVWGKEYWSEYLGKLGIVGNVIEQVATKLPDHIISVSARTTQMLGKSVSLKYISTVSNGISLGAIENIKISSSPTDIIYVGRLVEFKNVHLIIEALAYLKARGTVLQCAIIGDGPARTRLQKLAKSLTVCNQIHWHGFLEQSEEVYSHIKASKMFILPSQREGFGIVAIESNACGNPVLTANYTNNAASELIEVDFNGYVFEPITENLCEYILKTLDNLSRLRYGAKSYSQNFDWSSLVKQQLGAYLV